MKKILKIVGTVWTLFSGTSFAELDTLFLADIHYRKDLASVSFDSWAKQTLISLEGEKRSALEQRQVSPDQPPEVVAKDLAAQDKAVAAQESGVAVDRDALPENALQIELMDDREFVIVEGSGRRVEFSSSLEEQELAFIHAGQLVQPQVFVRDTSKLGWHARSQTVKSLRSGESEIVVIWNDQIYFVPTQTKEEVTEEIAPLEEDFVQTAPVSLRFKVDRSDFEDDSSQDLSFILVESSVTGALQTDELGFVDFGELPLNSQIQLTIKDPLGRIPDSQYKLFTDPDLLDAEQHFKKDVILTSFESLRDLEDKMVPMHRQKAQVCGFVMEDKSNPQYVPQIYVTVDLPGHEAMYTEFGRLSSTTEATTQDGQFCFFNLPNGPLTFSFMDARYGHVLGSYTTSVAENRMSVFDYYLQEKTLKNLEVRARVEDDLGYDFSDGEMILEKKPSPHFEGSFYALASDEVFAQEDKGSDQFYAKTNTLRMQNGTNYLYFVDEQTQGKSIANVLYQVDRETVMLPVFKRDSMARYFSLEKKTKGFLQFEVEHFYELDKGIEVYAAGEKEPIFTAQSKRIVRIDQLEPGEYQIVVKKLDETKSVVAAKSVTVFANTLSYTTL